MPIFMLLFVLAPLAGVVVAKAIRISDFRSQRTEQLPEQERLAADIRRFGLQRVLAAEEERLRAATAPERAELAERQHVEQRARARFDKHGKNVLDAHEHLVAYVVLLVLPAVAAVFLFVANRGLDIGLIETLQISDAQAVIYGSIIVVFTALLGTVVLELLFPGSALPALRALPRATRLGWAVAVGALFVGILALLPMLATARAQARLGEAVAKARASCQDVTADQGATPGEKTLACAAVERRQTQLDRAREWDTLVAVAAPAGEAAGSWAFLRLAEAGVAGALAAGSRRARRRRVAAEATLQQVNDEFIAILVRAGLLADASQEDIDNIRRGGVAEPGGGEDPPPAPPPPPGDAIPDVGDVPQAERQEDAQAGGGADVIPTDATAGKEAIEPPIVIPEPATDQPIGPTPLGGDRWGVV